MKPQPLSFFLPTKCKLLKKKKQYKRVFSIFFKDLFHQTPFSHICDRKQPNVIYTISSTAVHYKIVLMVLAITVHFNIIYAP